MMLGNKTFRIAFAFVMFLFFFPTRSMSQLEPSIKINVNGSIIDVEASEVALGDVLKAISEKTGVALKSGDRLKETVSFSFRGMPPEEAFKRLLANRSYVLTYRRADGGRYVPDELRVLGNQSVDAVKIPSPSIPDFSLSDPQQDLEDIPANDNIKKLDRGDFIQQFNDTDLLMKEMVAVPITEGPFTRGIRITDLAQSSALLKIGLKRGDIIENIDGSPAISAEQFLESLQSVPEERSVVMIKLKRDDVLASIYLQLH